MGLNKRDFFLNDCSYRGAELTTWVVSRAAAGQGIGTRILAHIQSSFDVLIGMGITDAALPIYMRSGFRFLKSIPRFIKVLNFEKVKNYATYTDLGIKLADQWSLEQQKNFVLREASVAEYNDIFLRQKQTLNMFSRDDRHRAWRYENHPVFQYKQFLVGEAEGSINDTAFVAIREELSVSDLRVLHVMDLFGDDLAMRSGVNFIENYSAEHGFDIVDFYCTASNVSRWVLANGWFSINDDACFQFPHLFRPVEMRNPPTTSLVYWAKDNLQEIADISSLYITKQDADLDRPTPEPSDSNKRGTL
jgi:hypothetical protein